MGGKERIEEFRHHHIGSFALIVVLFILLIIVGCACISFC